VATAASYLSENAQPTQDEGDTEYDEPGPGKDGEWHDHRKVDRHGPDGPAESDDGADGTEYSAADLRSGEQQAGERHREPQQRLGHERCAAEHEQQGLSPLDHRGPIDSP